MLGLKALQRPLWTGSTLRPAICAARRRAYSDKGGRVFESTQSTFEKDVLDAGVPTVVDFYASWCAPCKMLGPIIDRAVQQDGRVNLAKVNVDENLDLAADYKISSLPTVVGFRGGQPVAAFVGMRPPPAVAEFVQSLATGEPEKQ